MAHNLKRGLRLLRLQGNSFSNACTPQLSYVENLCNGNRAGNTTSPSPPTSPSPGGCTILDLSGPISLQAELRRSRAPRQHKAGADAGHQQVRSL